MSDFDLIELAERVKSAAQKGLKVTVSNNELMLRGEDTERACRKQFRSPPSPCEMTPSWTKR